ncbi:hypothetical protein ACJ6WD_09460 [Streptomyces sp. VTCC 41912]|uniref:hypothetical protein n=1 Tax=Streptomyces TaxID=1883 RepID=UPI002F26056D
MAAPKATPRPKPALENFHTVADAAIRLGLRRPDDASNKGEKWLRDGVNRKPADGKGEPFPCHRMAGQLMFSDSDLAEIAAMHRCAPQRRGRKRRTPLTAVAA